MAFTASSRSASDSRNLSGWSAYFMRASMLALYYRAGELWWQFGRLGG
jgi:hypothetical protein